MAPRTKLQDDMAAAWAGFHISYDLYGAYGRSVAAVDKAEKEASAGKGSWDRVNELIDASWKCLDRLREQTARYEAEVDALAAEIEKVRGKFADQAVFDEAEFQLGIYRGSLVVLKRAEEYFKHRR